MSKVNTKQTSAPVEDETKPTLLNEKNLVYINNIIKELQTLNKSSLSLLNTIIMEGPVLEKNVSKFPDLTTLFALNMVARIIVRGEEGYVACTSKGKDTNTLATLYNKEIQGPT